MQIRQALWGALLLAALAPALACRKEAPKEEQAATPAAPAAGVVTQSGGTIAPKATTKDLFTNGRESFVKKDAKAAAARIRESAALVRDEATIAVLEGKADLEKAAAVLDSLAMRVERGSEKDVRELDMAFARAHQAEAHAHLLQAKVDFTANRGAKAGQELGAAVASYEEAATRAGISIGPSTKATLAQARTLAGTLGTPAATPSAFNASFALMSELVKAQGKRLGRGR